MKRIAFFTFFALAATQFALAADKREQKQIARHNVAVAKAPVRASVQSRHLNAGPQRYSKFSGQNLNRAPQARTFTPRVTPQARVFTPRVNNTPRINNIATSPRVLRTNPSPVISGQPQITARTLQGRQIEQETRRNWLANNNAGINRTGQNSGNQNNWRNNNGNQNNWQNRSENWRRRHGNWNRHHHNRSWWRSNFTRFALFGGGYYYWNGGYWYPAYGYDPYFSTYSYDAPIYAYNDQDPGQVIANVQVELQRRGYNPGGVDGTYGPMTRSALIRYQSDNGLEPTGEIDEDTLNSLGLQ